MTVQPPPPSLAYFQRLREKLAGQTNIRLILIELFLDLAIEETFDQSRRDHLNRARELVRDVQRDLDQDQMLRDVQREPTDVLTKMRTGKL